VTWRLRIEHHTGFNYGAPVVASYNEARIMPLSTPEQLVIEAEVTITPPASVFRYWDYWGTLVYSFDIHAGHTELEVCGRSQVETSAPRTGGEGTRWDDLRSPATRDGFAEYLAPTSYVPLAGREIAEAARELAGGRSPADACRATSAWARDRLRYEQGTTTVSTTALDALAHGSGVCQDFAHVHLALLRSMGVPARYVSGYLHPHEDAPVGQPVEGESHAWVEAWLGDWMPFDPTNGLPVGERHVVIGRARDYADVSPLKGVYHGGPAEALAVTVTLTRLA
jgi:transglutaminase-like putative cysteine protease